MDNSTFTQWTHYLDCRLETLLGNPDWNPFFGNPEETSVLHSIDYLATYHPLSIAQAETLSCYWDIYKSLQYI